MGDDRLVNVSGISVDFHACWPIGRRILYAASHFSSAGGLALLPRRGAPVHRSIAVVHRIIAIDPGLNSQYLLNCGPRQGGY